MMRGMVSGARQLAIDADTFHVSRGHMLLSAQLRETLIVCLNDDTQGIGGMLHLRLAVAGSQCLDLTDNTLSLNLLLVERFMKELRSTGARNAALKGTLVAHVPRGSRLEVPADTLIGLLVAYYADARIPMIRREIRHVPAVAVLFEPREGRMFLSGETTAAAPESAGTSR
jgi:chemotaxis receptor (MCP) glutamine deamidase CheD